MRATVSVPSSTLPYLCINRALCQLNQDADLTSESDQPPQPNHRTRGGQCMNRRYDPTGQLPLEGDGGMDTTTLLIIIIVLLVLGGGGWYGRGRWF
jgi:hypothetical protein